jgi:hypothetical protein
VDGISALLEGLQFLPNSSVPASPDRQSDQPSSISSRPGAVRARLSSTDPNILKNRKIPIVSTSVSSLETEFGEVFQSNRRDMSSNRRDMVRQEGKALESLRRRLLLEMEDLTESDVSTSRVHRLELDLADIKTLRNQYQDGVLDFIEEYKSELEEDPIVLQEWRADVSAVGLIVKRHADTIRTKKESLFPSPQLSDMDRQTLEFYRATMEFQKLSLQDQRNIHADQQQNKYEESRILAETEANTFLGECSVLGDIMTDETWDEVDDETVSDAMRKLSKWQDQMTSIERSYRKYENMATKHNFPTEKQEAIKHTYDDQKDKFENTKEAVQREDTARGLFTLEPAKSDIIKYPVFSGLPSEDYLKFKETMTQRFRENKVKRKEQVAKLRECLKGAALGRVPDGIKDIEEAFNRLNEAFGNPSKVMSYNLKAIDDLGTMPPDRQANGQLNYSRRIEWFLKLEVILGKILELSKRSSRLAHEAFASSTYRRLWSKFSTSVLDKLVKIQGEDGDRMQAILDKIRQMRQHAQIMDDECGNATAAAKKKGDGTVPNKVIAEIFFRTPSSLMSTEFVSTFQPLRKVTRICL